MDKDREFILSLLMKTIQLFIADEQIPNIETVDEATPLFGKDAAIDSMGIVSIIAEVEEQLIMYGHDIEIISDKAMSQKNSPFQTIGTLTDFIVEELKLIDVLLTLV